MTDPPEASFTLRSVFSIAESIGVGLRKEWKWRKIASHLAVSKDPCLATRAFLREGAAACVMWELTDDAMQPLVDIVVTPRDYFSRRTSSYDIGSPRIRCGVKFELTLVSLMVVVNLVNFAYGLTITLTSPAYPYLGWSLLASRGCALGTLTWTAILLFSMSRSVTSWCYKHTGLLIFLDSMGIHLLAVKNLCACVVIHTAVHMAKTATALLSRPASVWNSILKCAKQGYLAQTVLAFPSCPFPDQLGNVEVFLSTPFFTGYLLICVFVLFGISSRRSRRDRNHRFFRVTHNLLISAWLILLYFHGASQWLGHGFPLVLAVCLPVLLVYFFHKTSQHIFADACRIDSFECITENLLVLRLQYRFPMREGMFVLLAVPEISRFDFHPFSIAESTEKTITLNIRVRGRWTVSLRDACNRLTRVLVAGPYVAPACSIGKRAQGDVLVIIASGVGITAFLNSISVMSDRSCRVYVLWVVRQGIDVQQASETLQAITNDHKISVSVFVTSEGTTKASRFFIETVRRLPGQLVVNAPGSDTASIRLVFNRPQWSSEFSNIQESGTRWVYACGQKQLLEDVRKACNACSDLTGHGFVSTFEEL